MRHLRAYLLAAPALLFISAAFMVPVAQLLFDSLRTDHPGDTFTLSRYAAFFADGYGWEILLRTLRIGLLTVLACLTLAFPVALLMRQLSPRWRSLLAIALLSPLLTSVVVRTLAWVVLLGPTGLVNGLLDRIGFGTLPLMYNDFGVIVGLTHVFFGYMLLALAASTLRLDDNLLLAAANLGAGRWHTLRHVILPLCMPGIVSGSILVFTMSASAYIVPVLLGGSATKVMATEIYDLAINYLEWQDAAAIAATLFGIMWLTVSLMNRLSEPLRKVASPAESTR